MHYLVYVTTTLDSSGPLVSQVCGMSFTGKPQQTSEGFQCIAITHPQEKCL